VNNLLNNAGVTGEWVEWPGGYGTFVAFSANFEGATVSLQMTPDDGTTIVAVGDDFDQTAIAHSANGYSNFKLGPGVKIRALVASAGSPTPSLNARVF